MINKAIFLDRDGTINVEKNYLHRIQDFEFLPDVIEALKLFQKNNFMLIIITNQSGIARGYYTEKEYLRLNAWLMDELLNHYHVQKMCIRDIPSVDKGYFGVGISPDISLITYAVSCGQMGKTDKYPNEISSNIMRYRHISVRDQWTKEILEPYIIDKNIELVLDPTFLIDFSGKDSGLFSAQHYLLVYAFSEFSPDTILQIKEYANKNDLKIIRIGPVSYTHLFL